MTKKEFYNSAAWLRMRDRVLRRDGYMCRISLRFGKARQAEMVHHIFPLDEFPQYALAAWNLISLTNAVHNTLHDRETNELTAAGKELLRRTARQQGMEIPEKYR